MTSAQAYWGMLNSMSDTTWWIGMAVVFCGAFRLKIKWTKNDTVISVRFRTSIGYAIMACSALMSAVAYLFTGDLVSVCLAMAAFAMDVWFYRYFRKREDDDEDDKRRKKALKELGAKARAKLREMLGRLDPTPSPKPVPIPS